MHRSYSVAAVLALTVLALSPALLSRDRGIRLRPGARAADRRAAADPDRPGGADPAEEPTPQEPTGEQPAAETGGQLPRTGWDALVYFTLGVGLLLAGARLRVLTRIKQVVQRVRRRNTEAALREALEPIRAARLSPPEPDPDPGPLHVEPSTPTARRMTGVGVETRRESLGAARSVRGHAEARAPQRGAVAGGVGRGDHGAVAARPQGSLADPAA